MNESNKPKASAIDQLDVISHQVATDDAETGSATAKDRQWSRAVGVMVEARLAELRRHLTPEDAPTERAQPIRSSTLAMTRDALVAAITRLSRAMGGAVQFAHRNLTGLSDDDLRRLYDTLDPASRSPE